MGYIYYDDWYADFLAHAEVTRTDDMKYGLPDQKKYPMPDRKHVMSAIKFFNYVSPKDEETLAHAILARMKEYGIDEVNVGPDNRFSKYYKPDTLTHHQIKGAKQMDQSLKHSYKGTTWDKHKYIAIKNGRYIYPEDQRRDLKNKKIPHTVLDRKYPKYESLSTEQHSMDEKFLDEGNHLAYYPSVADKWAAEENDRRRQHLRKLKGQAYINKLLNIQGKI